MYYIENLKEVVNRMDLVFCNRDKIDILGGIMFCGIVVYKVRYVVFVLVRVF